MIFRLPRIDVRDNRFSFKFSFFISLFSPIRTNVVPPRSPFDPEALLFAAAERGDAYGVEFNTDGQIWRFWVANDRCLPRAGRELPEWVEEPDVEIVDQTSASPLGLARSPRELSRCLPSIDDELDQDAPMLPDVETFSPVELDRAFVGGLASQDGDGVLQCEMCGVDVKKKHLDRHYNNRCPARMD